MNETIAGRRILLVRHCRATGQEPDAPLTEPGHVQAEALASFLVDNSRDGEMIQRIVSSPFVRAQQSVEPLSRRLGLPVEVDPRLAERVLAATPSLDWRERLRASFDNLDDALEGGESGRAATQRALAVLDDALRTPAAVTVLVTHGNLLTLLLRHFDARCGFATWAALTNPDVFALTLDAAGTTARVERLWRDYFAAAT